jgi:diguanylate cyclase (GGDEF)-like protein
VTWPLTIYFLGGGLLFFVLIRTGWSERHGSDPGLMAWQGVHSVIATIWTYAIAGPARAAVLTALVLILAYTMFSLSARQARYLAVLSLTALGLTMAWMSSVDPERYPVWQEVTHWSFCASAMLGVSILAARMVVLRSHLKKQKHELEVSLERIRRLALQDDLTGLFNRRYMRMLLRSELARQQRTGQIMTLALIDLDHFKVVNDRHGHAAGDIVLRAFARNAGPCLRSTEVLARWGGEEFLLMMADTDQKEALKCLERIRTSLAQTLFDELSPGLHVTFSAGLTPCYPGESFEAVMERVDQAMYRAKEAGRDRTVSA